jgi:hypothetical protein
MDRLLLWFEQRYEMWVVHNDSIVGAARRIKHSSRQCAGQVRQYELRGGRLTLAARAGLQLMPPDIQ